MSENNIQFYSKHAEKLAAQYEAVSFQSVHQDWLTHLPKEGWALDIGAGSGRDSSHLASAGLKVVAVEPAARLIEKAKELHKHKNIHWLTDTLPELKRVFALQIKFDLILLSAVWMHIAPSTRERAFRKLSSLLKPGGKMVITLRHGDSPDEREMHPVCASEIAALASKFGISYDLANGAHQQDQLGRNDVSWQTVILTLPDDGTGAFPLIRNIVVNDSKASTYKVALLRCLLRIAEGQPGSVLDQTDDFVALPMGLVALYWYKLYKPLLDTHNMRQSSTKKGLGFVKDGGWNELTSLSNNDVYLGARFSDPHLSKALIKCLKDISSTIKNMPATYITIPGTGDALFEVELTRVKQKSEGIVLDAKLLSEFGRFYVPKHIWNAFSRFSVWIEPALINEWSGLMEAYGRASETNYSKLDYLSALQWEEPKRTTTRVRNRILEIQTEQRLDCIWSRKKLSTNNFAVDHAFPFARWPNNDLWNLIPTLDTVNNKKSDKLPSSNRVAQSKIQLIDWWKLAWDKNQYEFFVQANFALPSLSAHNECYETVFDAFAIQRDRIKDFQQLEDW
jgi:SAM-dependent methyltransferase